MSTSVTQRLARIAVVGFPNVGKSTLVNRLVGGREAVVHQEAYGIPTTRTVGGEERELIGVNDLTPNLVEIVPDAEELATLSQSRGGEVPDEVLADGDCLDLLASRLERVPR